VKATQVLTWLRRDLSRFSGDDHIDLLEVGDNKVLLKVYTDVNQYTIHATVQGEKTYLGAQGASRKPRAGEKHTRGNDLSDGPLTEDTWKSIKNDIIGFELVRVRRNGGR
jgi:hypothetical protein